MTTRTPITDEQLLQLLRGGDPLRDSGPRSLQADHSSGTAEGLLRRILASERIAAPQARPQRPWRRRRAVVSVASATAVAAAATAASLVFTASNGAGVAFAGWTANPTAPANGQVNAAEAYCRRNPTLASLTPALADTRGPYTMLLYGQSAGILCVSGPSLESPTGEPRVAFFGEFLASSEAARRRAAAERGGAPSNETPPNSGSVARDAIHTVVKGAMVTPGSVPRAAFSFDVGHVGEGVTAVALVLGNGSRVQATTANGWFAAWWPGNEAASTAELTTARGTVTQQLGPGAPVAVSQRIRAR